MRILSQGLPFFCDYATLRLYAGPHEIRSVSAKNVNADYRFDPAGESFTDLLDRIRTEWVPDLYLCWTPENDPPPLGVEDSPIPTIALAGDWNLFFGAERRNLGRYDVVLCDKPGVSILTNEWVQPHYLFPLYAQNPLVHRSHTVERDIDVLYIGNLNILHRRERAWLLDRIAMLSDRYRVTLAGGLFGDDYARVLSRACIVFNRSVRGELNLRVFETMACGALAMLEDSNEEVRDWFTDGREIVLFNDTNLEQKIAYYLEHPEEREAIAARGQARVREFAGENRLNQLIDFALSQKFSGRRFKELPPIERLVEDYLQYSFRLEPEYYPVQERLAAKLARIAPEDPRTWTAVGQVLLRSPSPENSASRHVQAERCLKAFTRAVRLATSCGTLAMNAATACRSCGAHDVEPAFLHSVLTGENADLPEYLIGDYLSAFWTRWLFALAKGRADLAALKAEAHVRLARVAAQNGRPGEALAHLEEALRMDPENTGGMWLQGELLWEQNRREEAAALLDRYVPQFPLHEGYRKRLAAMFAELGEIDRAHRLLEEARRIGRAIDRKTLGEPAP